MLQFFCSGSYAPVGPRIDRQRSVRATRALTLFLIAATSASFEGTLKVFVGAPALRSGPLRSVAMNVFTAVPESAKQEPAKEEDSAAVPKEKGPKSRLYSLVQKALRKPMAKGDIWYVTDSSTGVSESTLTLPVLGHDELLSFKGSGEDQKASEANAAQVAIDQLRSTLEEQAAALPPLEKRKKKKQPENAETSARTDLIDLVQRALLKAVVVGDIVYTTVSSGAGFESTLTMPVMGKFSGLFKGTAASKKGAEEKAATLALDHWKSSLQDRAEAAQLKKREQRSLDLEKAAQEFAADIIHELDTGAKSIEMELTRQQFQGLLQTLANLPDHFQASSQISPILQETSETTQRFKLRINRDAALPVGATSVKVAIGTSPSRLAADIRQSMEEKSERPDLHVIGSTAAKRAMNTIRELQKYYTQEGRCVTFMSRRHAMTTADDVELQGIAVSLMVT